MSKGPKEKNIIKYHWVYFFTATRKITFRSAKFSMNYRNKSD